MVMITLVGEQPTPTLIPLKYLKPEHVVLVRTDNKRVKDVSENLSKLIAAAQPLDVPPYDIGGIFKELEAYILASGWQSGDLLFNLTGGTKPMAFAAFRLAEKIGGSFVYLQSEGRKSLLYRYDFDRSRGFVLQSKDEIPEVITIDDYLKAHGLWNYTSRSLKESFEMKVYQTLQDAVANQQISEIKSSVWQDGLQIDVMLRFKNQIGVAEIKTGRAAESSVGINQLNTASEQRFLGTFISKFLILDRVLDSNNQALAEAHRVEVIVLRSRAGGNDLSKEVQTFLIETIRQKLGA